MGASISAYPDDVALPSIATGKRPSLEVRLVPQPDINFATRLPREQLYASINIMEESIAARGAPPGNKSLEGAGDGAWLCPRRTFQPHA